MVRIIMLYQTHVFVELGMTKPNLNLHSSMHEFWKKMRCSIRRF